MLRRLGQRWDEPTRLGNDVAHLFQRRWTIAHAQIAKRVTRVRGPIVHRRGTEYLLLVVPFSSILFQGRDPPVLAAQMKYTKRQSAPHRIDAVVETVIRHQHRREPERVH